MFFFVIEAFGTNAQPASGGCSTQRVWDYPNKHFATQKWRLYRQKSRRMAENNIPYKVRAALLLVPLNTPMPTGAVTQSLWYIAVRSGDVHRVQHYLRTERDT